MLKNNRTGIIYKATCTETGDAYIGRTTRSLDSRQQEHLQKALGGSDTPFHQAIREHGADAFFWEVLASGIPQARLVETERYSINHYNTFSHGYNANQGGKDKRARKSTLLSPVRWVSENELVLHWKLNRERNEEHVYALAQDMQAIGGFDPLCPIDTVEIEGKLHVYSGHHRVAAAFSRDTCFPLLPLGGVPVTVIQGDMDTLIENMWRAHDVHNRVFAAGPKLQLTYSEKAMKYRTLMSFPHIYRQPSAQLCQLWNVTSKIIDWLRHEVRDDLWGIISSDKVYPNGYPGWILLEHHHYTPKRLAAMIELIKSDARTGVVRKSLQEQVVQAETILQSALQSAEPTLSEIPKQKIQWLSECLTLALPNTKDRLAALQILLKRLAEDL